MKIEMEIPKEFEEHFKQDKLEDSLQRLNADAHLIAGNYEKETAIMLIEAFKNSKVVSDRNKVVENFYNEYEPYLNPRNEYEDGFNDGCKHAFLKVIDILDGDGNVR